MKRNKHRAHNVPILACRVNPHFTTFFQVITVAYALIRSYTTSLRLCTCNLIFCWRVKLTGSYFN